MKNIFRIVKKELDKVFKFPRTIFTTLILPGLLLFIIYAFIGMGMDSILSEDNIRPIHIINMPQSFDEIYDQYEDKFSLVKSGESELNDLKDGILAGEVGAIIYYIADFDSMVGTNDISDVTILFDYSSPESSSTADFASMIVDEHRENVYNERGIKIFKTDVQNLADPNETSGAMLAMLLPMLLMTFIFASALSLGSDAIAGEKERGTLATLLMMPIKRSEIILGKIISVSTLTVLSAISSFVGLLASLPFAKSLFGIGEWNYGVFEILGLFVILLLIALLASSMLLVISALAKNIKEASTMSMPIYILAIIVPVITMFSQTKDSSIALYFIPVYNTVLGLKELLGFNFDLVHFLIIILSSLAYVFILILVLVKLFKNEKILYTQ